MCACIFTHADSSAKLIPIVCAILVVTVATLATIIILVLCKLKKCTRRKLNKCSAEASRLSTDHGESAPDERGNNYIIIFRDIISWNSCLI